MVELTASSEQAGSKPSRPGWISLVVVGDMKRLESIPVPGCRLSSAVGRAAGRGGGSGRGVTLRVGLLVTRCGALGQPVRGDVAPAAGHTLRSRPGATEEEGRASSAAVAAAAQG